MPTTKKNSLSKAEKEQQRKDSYLKNWLKLNNEKLLEEYVDYKCWKHEDPSWDTFDQWCLDTITELLFTKLKTCGFLP